MDKHMLWEALEIRYMDLHVFLRFTADCILPEHKASALRGGMGQMLLQRHCLREMQCGDCDFQQDCLVQRMMYAQYEIQPRFGGEKESMGYIIDCTNRQEHFHAGELLDFHLILFGKTLACFADFLEAFSFLGRAGLGKNKARFDLFRVLNRNNERMLRTKTGRWMGLCIDTVGDHVERRLEELRLGKIMAGQAGPEQLPLSKTMAGPEQLPLELPTLLVFETPAAIKYQGELLQRFNADAVIKGIFRRIYSFDCFEGRALPLMAWEDELPEILSQRAVEVSVKRYSSRKGEQMRLKGLLGEIFFAPLPEELLMVLLAGEILHIGKNTSFGFGRYRLLEWN